MARRKKNVNGSDQAEAILMVVMQIPAGKVATYGQIAALAGIPKNARQVGSVLKNLPPGAGVPWYRVLNSKGEISTRGDGDGETDQRAALLDEDVRFDQHGRVSLKQYRWNP